MLKPIVVWTEVNAIRADLVVYAGVEDKTVTVECPSAKTYVINFPTNERARAYFAELRKAMLVATTE
jgi:hypothetical protein